MRGKRFAQRCSSENGSVIPFIALGMTALLLFLALALDQGVMYVGRTQLQQMVDASSRAALLALAKPGAKTEDARAAAFNIAQQSPVMQGGFAAFIPDEDFTVTFGSYDFMTGKFEDMDMPVGGPQAVLISASRAGEGRSAFSSLLTGKPIEVNAASIAALRCRNVVFVQDVSSSFQDDIMEIQTALLTTMAILSVQEGFTSLGTKVGLVAFRNIVVPAGSTSRMVSPDSPEIIDAINALDDPSVLCQDEIVANGRRLIIPACVGSDMKAGLEQAEELLKPENGKQAACEDLVLTISDGVPCKVTLQSINLDLPPGFDSAEFGPALPNEPQGGGSTREETLAYVDDEMRQSGSIAVLTSNSGGGSNRFRNRFQDALKTCPENRGLDRTQNRALDTEFANKLISGFGQTFEASRNVDKIAEQMSAALRTIPPVVVR